MCKNDKTILSDFRNYSNARYLQSNIYFKFKKNIHTHLKLKNVCIPDYYHKNLDKYKSYRHIVII